MMLMGRMAKKQKLSYLAYSIITVMFCLPTAVLAQETVEHTQAITSVTAQTETVEKTTVSVTQQAQAILKQQPKIEPLTFDDLEHYQTHADVAMMNEIYQVAEQAKKRCNDMARNRTNHNTAIAKKYARNFTGGTYCKN